MGETSNGMSNFNNWFLFTFVEKIQTGNEKQDGAGPRGRQGTWVI